MSSPPTPNTSLKAAPLRPAPHKHQRHYSFPSIAALNPFRRKASPKVPNSPSPREPYEVAPGIWNTDATAKVFGYLEPNEKKEKSRTKGVDLTTRNIGQIPQRKSVPQSIPRIQGIKNLDETHRNYVELPGQIVDDRLKRSQETGADAWNPVDKRKMRTVSRDDQLVQRGANPRTGLVSPFAVSDSSDDNLSRDYVNSGRKLVEDRSSSKGRSQSGKWKQKGAGWALVESPLLSPIPQSINEPLSRRLSVQQLEDKLLVEMPGVDNPEPQNLTDEQIKKYQEGIGRAYQHGGDTAMIDPSTLPSPRAFTPDGPSTPPNKLQRIRRKMVGSGSNRREGSNEMTVISTQQRASSAPISKGNVNELSRQRTEVSPDAGKGFSSKPPSERSSNFRKDPFLGQRNEPLEGNTGRPSAQTTRERAAQSGSPDESIHRFKTDFVNPQASPNLNQYLPRLNLLHPSHFANLETSSYRRPTQLLPDRLRRRPAAQQNRIIEDACTTTTISTLHKELENRERPGTRRRDESTMVPTMTTMSYLKSEIPKENCPQVGTVKKKPSFVIKHTGDILKSNMTREVNMQLPEPVILQQETAELRHQMLASPKYRPHNTRTPHHHAERGAKFAMTESCHSQALHQDLLKKRSSMTSVTQGTSLIGADIAQGQIPGGLKSGAGITHTSGHLGNSCGVYGCNKCATERRAESNQRTRRRPNASTGIACSPERGAEFVDRSVERLSKDIPAPPGARTQDLSFIGSAAETKHISRILCRGRRYLHEMACHILQTLHPVSPALVALKANDVSTREYLFAAKEVVLAVLYLLLLSILLLALRKMLFLMGMVLFWMWHPVRMMVVIFKWCVLA